MIGDLSMRTIFLTGAGAVSMKRIKGGVNIELDGIANKLALSGLIILGASFFCILISYYIMFFVGAGMVFLSGQLWILKKFL